MQKIFVEIGVADFDTLMPLLKNGWKGVFVEPVPRYAEKLRDQIEGLDAVVVEAAISDYDGEADFLVSKALGNWVDGISHIDSPLHEGTALLHMPSNKQFIESRISVPCMTLDSLLESQGIDHVDLMKIDIEGHEMNVIRNYSWRIKPACIKIEHAHVNDVMLKVMLERQGYLTQLETHDIYAWQ